jgi:2-Cys peroxiredoxin 5
MSAILVSASQAAHTAAAALLSKAQIKPGETIPTGVKVKEDSVETPFELVLTGKNLVLGVPAAFSGPCSNQVPGYVDKLTQFREKGIKDIYVVAVNDAFVTKAWKEKLGARDLHFIADDSGSLTSQLGLMFDATPLLGAPRSKRYAIITNGMTTEHVIVEEDSTKSTVTKAENVLAVI